MTALPSPTLSATALEGVAQQPSNQTKKRQRSASMQSAGSVSSPKRSQSEGPSQDVTNAMTATTSALESQDVSMSSQLSDTPTEPLESTQETLSAAGVRAEPMWQNVPAEDKVRLADEALKQPLKEADPWYLVSFGWYKRWHKAVTGEEDKEGTVEENDLGPVDNTDLVEADGSLVQALLTEDEDIKFVSERLWMAFVEWYGKPQHVLRRTVRSIGNRGELTIEIRPPSFKPLLLVSDDDYSITGPSLAPITLSASSTVHELETALHEAVKTLVTHQTGMRRIWMLLPPRTQVEGCRYPVSRLLEVGGKLCQHADSDTLEDALISSNDLFAVEFANNNLEWLVDSDKVPSPDDVNNSSTQLAAEREQPRPLFSGETDFFSRLSAKSSSTAAASTDIAIRTPTSPSLSSGKLKIRASPSSAFKGNTSVAAKPRIPGTLGLGNMGNTCFMNSALQCLAHTPELADYFLIGVFKDELNPDNPLGMQGAIAEAFGALLHRIWASTGTASSYSPREFKQALQRFAPQFSGYQQHDSQELVAFLLDGLHEDLNRILTKPYVEKPDWEGGGALEMIKLAIDSWEGYLKRNDSVIVDLFQGQYRSTLICPECKKVSITFDPFMYLTLPLPVKQKWKHEIFYVPWNSDKPHQRVAVEMNADASFKDLKVLLGRWMDADPQSLVTMEIFHNKFYRAFDDGVPVNDTQSGDLIVCYELPCKAHQTRTYQRQPEDPFIVPVFLTESQPVSKFSYSRSPSMFGYPFFVAVTPEQAKDETKMYELIVEKLERWSSHARDLYTWQVGGASDMVEVPIPISVTQPTVETITEIQENGEIVQVEQPVIEEGDIVDERAMIIEDTDLDQEDDGPPVKVGPKANIFNLCLVPDYNKQSAGYSGYGNQNARSVDWDSRRPEDEGSGDLQPILLQDRDALFCEFDENMKDYFFGSEKDQFEHARWDDWGQPFVHPELEETRKQSSAKRNTGISLQDCLDEFTKEEQLGEEDLWYCPRCKKHQQATKKFDLWSVPDVLVVHLKRFSSSRTMRDKLDTLVDFPIHGLDLEPMVEQRKVLRTLQADGIDTTSLNVGNLDEGLVYDLFAVDEHLGGLGGGHYRAYALNHVTEKWYHFDDSFVTESSADDSINSNAYLLFYRRRSSHPLGGKSHEKIEEARSQAPVESETSMDDAAGQLPTPPDEGPIRGRQQPAAGFFRPSGLGLPSSYNSSASSSPPELDDPPNFDDSHNDEIMMSSLAPLDLGSENFDFPDPTSSRSLSVSAGSSPRSSIGASNTLSWVQNTNVRHVLDEDYDAADKKEPVVEIPIDESTLDDIE